MKNISKWVFGLLALITVALGVYFYMNLKNVSSDGRADMLLNWGYILIILGIALALISAFFTGIVKGVKGKKLLILVVAFAIIAVVAYIMSKAAFTATYPIAGQLEPLSEKTHGLVELGLNFFYVIFGVAILSILFSVVYKAVKK